MKCTTEDCKKKAKMQISVDTGVVQPMCKKHVLMAFQGYLQLVEKYGQAIYVQRYPK